MYLLNDKNVMTRGSWKPNHVFPRSIGSLFTNSVFCGDFMEHYNGD